MQALSAAHHSPNLTVEEVSSAAFKITLIMLVTAFSFQKVILTHSLPSWVLKLCLMSYLFPHNGVTFEYLFSQWLFQTKNITLWVKALHGAEVSERMWWKNIVLIQILPISCRIFFFFFLPLPWGIRTSQAIRAQCLLIPLYLSEEHAMGDSVMFKVLV